MDLSALFEAVQQESYNKASDYVPNLDTLFAALKLAGLHPRDLASRLAVIFADGIDPVSSDTIVAAYYHYWREHP